MSNLKIQIEILDVNDLTSKEKLILTTIAGDKIAVSPVVVTPIVDTIKDIPTSEVKNDTLVEETPVTKPTRTRKPKGANSVEPSATEDTSSYEDTPDDTPPVNTVNVSVDLNVFTPDVLNDYAKQNVKPEFGPHYKAILAKYGVTKFKDIPADKCQEAKKLIDNVIATVV